MPNGPTLALRLVLVASGGAIGSVARCLLSQLRGGDNRWPVGTLLANLLGCAVIGLLAGLGERGQWASEQARMFLMVGVLGGFTTFSAFGLEALTMMKRGDWPMMLGYVAASVLGGLIAVWLGWSAVGRLG
jgi:CrcB protein